MGSHAPELLRNSVSVLAGRVHGQHPSEEPFAALVGKSCQLLSVVFLATICL